MLKNQTIGFKTSILVFSTLLLMTSLVVLNIYQITEIGTELKKIADEDIQVTKSLSKISVYTNMHSQNFQQLLIQGESINSDPFAAEQFRRSKDDFFAYGKVINDEIEKSIRLLEASYRNDSTKIKSEKAIEIDYELRGIHKEFSDYQFLAERTINLVFLKKYKEANQARKGIRSEKKDLDSGIGNLLVEIDSFTNKSVAHAKDIEKNAMIGSIIMSIVIILLSLLFGLFFTRSIARPIIQLKNTVEKMGQGQLDVHVEIHSKDEMGSLAKSFNQMAQDLSASRLQLYDSKDYVENILKSMTSSLIVINPDYTVRKVNHATLALLDYKEIDILGLPIINLVKMGELLEFFLGFGMVDVDSHASVQDRELFYISKEGTEIPMLFSGSMMQDGNGDIQGIVCIAQDLRKQKEYENEIREAQITAEAANAAKSQFLSRMSHELRTPLNAIIGFSSIMKQRLEPSALGKYAKFPSIINDSGKQLLDLVNDILDIVEVERGELSVKMQLCSLERAVRDAVERSNGLLDKLNITISTSNIDYQVMADPRRLTQVLFNLLSNAIKYNRADGTVEIVAKEENSGNVTISIIDTGVGIPENELGVMFDPLTRLNYATNSTIDGRGIGLSVCKSLVEEMDGILQYNCAEGEGSKFSVTLHNHAS